MDAPPITLFAKKTDPDGVRRLIIAAHPDAEIEESQGGWASILVRRKRGMFKKAQTLKVNNNPAYYTGTDWAKQKAGMKGYFLRFPMKDDRRDQLTAVIEEFAFALTFVSDPPVSPGDNDFRYDLMLEIAKHLDACFFLPSYLLDNEGRVLISPDGDFDPNAKFPQTAAAPVRSAPQGSNKKEDLTESEDLDPPSPDRIAARAIVLAAVSARGLIDLNASEQGADLEELEATRNETLEWCTQLGIDEEIEPDERRILETPVGKLNERDHLDSIWRFEGLAVLAWALDVHPLPPYDEVVTPDDLLPSLGYLNLSRAREIIQSPRLVSTDELDALNRQMLAYHWRLREFGIQPKKMDFRDFGKTGWLAPVDLSWANFDDNELALDGTGIDRADPALVETCSSIGAERHLASNWLCGWSKIYSETDTST